MPTKSRKPHPFPLQWHEETYMPMLKASLASEMAVHVAQMTKLVRLQDAISAHQRRIDYAKAHGIKTLSIHPTPQEKAALGNDNETGTRKG